ncbi:MAG: hypothetical protein ACTHJQ_25475 [Rhizobiaceae bacterium]
MSWYNPFSWFAAAKSEVVAVKSDVASEAVSVEEKVKEVFVSLESEAISEVEGFESELQTRLAKLTDFQARLEQDIADKTEALKAVKDAVAKAQTAAPAASAPAPVQPEQPVAA